MKLRLSVIAYQNRQTAMPMGTEFGPEGGSIGRSSNNDWVLPDPERFISGRHASISSQNGQYYLTDTSTNGVYLNHSLQPVGKGNRVPLSDGDRISIGEYEIEVALLEPREGIGAPATGEGELFAQAAPASPPSEFSLPELEELDDLDITSPTENSVLSPPVQESGGSEADQVPADNQFFQPPQSIPEDWDILADEGPEEAGDFSSSQMTSPVPEPQPSPPPAPAAPPVSAGPAVPAASDQEGLNTLLLAAGLEPLEIPPEAAKEKLTMLGQLLREIVAGLMEVLRARAQIKSEFRMQLTTIRPVENNPLKFSVSVEDAFRHLLNTESSAYLPPLVAVREAIEDIEAHQLAVMVGMQAALSAMLQRFEPNVLEQYFERKGGRGMLESRKSWYWEQYAEKHKEILSEAEDNFQDLFGEAFARAYEEQIAKLARARDSH